MQLRILKTEAEVISDSVEKGARIGPGWGQVSRTLAFVKAGDTTPQIAHAALFEVKDREKDKREESPEGGVVLG